MSDPKKLKFTVAVLDFSSELLSMKLKFENPNYVSATSEKDVLVVNMKNFEDKDG